MTLWQPQSFIRAISSELMPPSGPMTIARSRISGWLPVEGGQAVPARVLPRDDGGFVRFQRRQQGREGNRRIHRHHLAAPGLLAGLAGDFLPALLLLRTVLGAELHDAALMATGTTRAAPSSTAFCTISSIFSAFGRP